MIVGVDLDGILADFNEAYIKLLTKQSGIVFPPISDAYPDTWYYEKAIGVSEEDQKAVWEHIEWSEDFWLSLKPYWNACGFLVRLRWVKADTYFITNRKGRTAKWQTERWLHKCGFPEPTVLLASQKGMLCNALNITHYIDDKIENCEDVRNNSVGHCYMLKRPWNKPVKRVPVLNNLDEFLAVLMLDNLEKKDG